MFFEERLAAQQEMSRRQSEYENTSRYAVVTLVVESAGVGRSKHTTPLTFPAPFVEEPFMVQGSGVIANPDPGTHWEPEGTAGVWEWVRNDKGLYVAARIWTSVIFEARVENAPDVDAKVKVQHWLQFSGVAIKDFGREALDSALSLSPREVRF